MKPIYAFLIASLLTVTSAFSPASNLAAAQRMTRVVTKMVGKSTKPILVVGGTRLHIVPCSIECASSTIYLHDDGSLTYASLLHLSWLFFFGWKSQPNQCRNDNRRRCLRRIRGSWSRLLGMRGPRVFHGGRVQGFAGLALWKPVERRRIPFSVARSFRQRPHGRSGGMRVEGKIVNKRTRSFSQRH